MRVLLKGTFSLLLLLVCSVVIPIRAQHLERAIVGSAGTSVTVGDWRLDWTVGELAVVDLRTDELLLTQGFGQGALLFTSLREQKTWKQDILLFPNPAGTFLNLRKTDLVSFRIQVFDLSGKLILEEFWGGDSFALDVHALDPGGYFIRLTDESGAAITYPFIKK